MKRLFDIVGAAFGLLVLLPLGLFLGMLIKLSDGGPVFYSQERIGRFGRPFRIRKFRSMVVNADRLGVPLTKDRDPRITRIGRFLRKSKLDELPQLWNVLTGDMSFVGPRPEVPRYVDRYTPEQRAILNLKPGITDLATLLFRNEEALLQGIPDTEGFYLRYCLPRKIELNLHYARRAGLGQDLWIILQTICPPVLGTLLVYGLLLTVSFGLACLLHTNLQMTAADGVLFARLWGWMLLPQLLLLYGARLGRGCLSYFSSNELRRTALALALAAPLQLGLCCLVCRRLEPALRLLLLDLVLSCLVVGGFRLGLRLRREAATRSGPASPAQPRRVAVIGTGLAATDLALALSRTASWRVVAFFSDDPYAWHQCPHDIPVVGMPECLLNPEWAAKLEAVYVAMPEAEPARLAELRALLDGMPWETTFVAGWPVPETRKTVAAAKSL